MNLNDNIICTVLFNIHGFMRIEYTLLIYIVTRLAGSLAFQWLAFAKRKTLAGERGTDGEEQLK